MDHKVAQVRAALPSVQSYAYLNNGTAGPMPIQVQTAMVDALEAQVREGRITWSYFEHVFGVKDELRAAIAGMLGCSPSEVAVTHSTSEGMNMATLGINWVPGDEAITTNLEHPGALFPLYAARDRFNITIKVADLMSEPERATEILERLITSRTKLISLSHVSFSTGALLPIQEICAMAHKHGVLVLVDGAQSFAAIPVNVKELGCDFYAVPGQKWICGPEGTGALYASQQAISQTRVIFPGYFTADQYNTHGGFLPKDNAQRFEQGTMQPAGLAGLLAAQRWLTREVGLDWAFARIQHLARTARERLAAVKGVTVLTPKEMAGLVSFQMDGVAPEAAVAELKQQGIVMRTIGYPQCLRLATGFYNTEEEIERTVAAVAKLANG